MNVSKSLPPKYIVALKSFGACIVLGSAFVVTSLPGSITAHASDATKFLKGLDGSYRGRGKASYSDGKKTMNVSCQIANKLSTKGDNLKITGVCATTQGKANVNGELRLKGAKVSGSFFLPSANMKLTKSSGRINGNEMIVTSFFVDESSGALTRIKQIVHKNGKGFSSRILTYDNASKKFEQSGTIKFTKK